MTRGRRRQPQRNPGRGKVVPFAIANYWGDEYNLAPTTVNQVKLLACTPQAPASADLQTNPLEQEATIVRIEGHIEFTNPSVTGNFDVYAGIYLASYDDTDVSFATQDPLVVADVMRPNWLALHVLTVDMSTTAHSTSAQRVSFSLNIRRRISIVTGKGLFLAMNQNGPAESTIQAVPWIRLWLSRTVA